MNPRVSIIVPAYNMGKYISRCIDSILAQTLTDFELIIIDDGSTDSTGEICNVYSKKDRRIKVIHKRNGGVSSARNAGLDIAEGEYILFCDSDDFVSKDWCSELLNVVFPKGSQLGVCGFHWYNNDKGEHHIKVFGSGSETEKIGKSHIFQLREADLFNVLWNKIFSSKVIKEHNLKFDTELSLGEDIIFILEYIRAMQGKIIIVNKPLYNYEHKLGDNLGSKYNDDLLEIYNKIFKKLYEVSVEIKVDLQEYGKSYYDSYFKSLLRVMENTMNKKNNSSLMGKIRYNSRILRSKEFKECLKNADTTKYNKYYLSFLKSQSYLLFFVFLRVCDFKMRYLST